MNKKTFLQSFAVEIEASGFWSVHMKITLIFKEHKRGGETNWIDKERAV